MCQAHLFARLQPAPEFSVENGIRFGKGLQLINILRDIPRDLREGRCYLPAEELRTAGLQPVDLLLASNEPRIRPVYDRWLERAAEHLRVGWAYTNAIPKKMFRLRLASAWPILIGEKTLERLRNGEAFNPAHRIKISRPEVRNIILRTILYYPMERQWRDMVR